MSNRLTDDIDSERANGSGETVSDVVFRRMRQDIILGTLAPGSRIKLEHARDRYSISISSLREILSRLGAESLVVAEGQRGFQVSPVSKQELLELADIRIVLECHALGLAFANGDLEWEGSVVAAHHRLAAVERTLLVGDASRTIDWVRYDWEFHQALVAACGSATLIRNLSSVFDRFIRYHMLAQSFRGKPVVDDHRLLLDHALKRQVDAAQDMLRHHVRKGVEHIMKSPQFLSSCA